MGIFEEKRKRIWGLRKGTEQGDRDRDPDGDVPVWYISWGIFVKQVVFKPRMATVQPTGSLWWVMYDVFTFFFTPNLHA